MKERKATTLAGIVAVLTTLFPAAAPGGGAGVLVVRPRVEPPKIRPGEKATIYINARDGYQRPLSGVSVKITADTGHFEANRERIVRGASDPRGEFKSEWQSDLRTKSGERIFTIIATKSGYLGRYPLWTKVTIESPADTDPDSPEKPDSGEFSSPLDRHGMP